MTESFLFEIVTPPRPFLKAYDVLWCLAKGQRLSVYKEMDGYVKKSEYILQQTASKQNHAMEKNHFESVFFSSSNITNHLQISKKINLTLKIHTYLNENFGLDFRVLVKVVSCKQNKYTKFERLVWMKIFSLPKFLCKFLYSLHRALSFQCIKPIQRTP